MAVSGSKCCTCSSRRKTSRRLGPYALGICDKRTKWSLRRQLHHTQSICLGGYWSYQQDNIYTDILYNPWTQTCAAGRYTPSACSSPHTIQNQWSKTIPEHNPECGKWRWKIKLTHQGRDIFLNGSKNSSMPNSSDLWKNQHNHSLLTINSSANKHVRCTFLDNYSAPTLLVEVFMSCKGPEEP